MNPEKKIPTLHTAPALLRGLDILEDRHAQPDEQTLSAIAARLGMPANSTLRLLATLESRGYIERDPDSLKYRLTRKASSLALTGARDQTLLESALPIMHDLRNRLGECVMLSVIEHGHGILIEQMQALHAFRFVCDLGSRHPLHASAPTKAMLAWMPEADRARLLTAHTFTRFTPTTRTSRAALEADLAETRDRGWAEDHSEELDGVHCVAAPIRDRLGYPIAALTVTAPTNRMGTAEIAVYGPMVAASSTAVSKKMGYRII